MLIRSKSIRCSLFVLGMFGLLLGGCSFQPEEKLDLSSVNLLLEIMQVQLDNNPNYESVGVTLSRLSEDARLQMIGKLIKRSKSDKALETLVDTLLASEGYQLYYRQFNNMTPEIHERIFYSMPVTRISSPASISGNLNEMIRHKDQIATWVSQTMPMINLDSVHAKTLLWLPEGSYDIPVVHFILDGNGDAFAREGEVVFDLYSLVFSELPFESRYDDLGSFNTEEIEKVLAHEFHHVYIGPTLYDQEAESSEWQSQFVHKLKQRFVSEGSAMHCNPPEGFKKEIEGDSAVVAFWIGELNRVTTGITSGAISENEAWEWLNNSYQSYATEVLKTYLAKMYEGEELEKMTQKLKVKRPTMIYTLGWWMMSHISKDGTDKTRYFELLSNPDMLFDYYNEAISGYDGEFTIKK